MKPAGRSPAICSGCGPSRRRTRRCIGFNPAAASTRPPRCSAGLRRRARPRWLGDVSALHRRRNRHHAGVVSAHGLAVARGHLITRAWRSGSVGPARSPTCSASRRISLAGSPRFGPSCLNRRSMPPTGAQNRRCGRPSFRAKCGVAIARGRGRRPADAGECDSHRAAAPPQSPRPARVDAEIASAARPSRAAVARSKLTR
jgi:hypothetical protein